MNSNNEEEDFNDQADEFYQYAGDETHKPGDSLINRRKMLRRAANRRSAQLSRARKKAHLEELKVENSRLQRLVDILDSQPELVFCIQSDGKITYMSERSESFMKSNLSEAGDSDYIMPKHLNQILNTESVQVILTAIEEVKKHSTPAHHNESNTLFTAKEIYFHEAFGYPLVGSLRCSKVVRRTTLQELQNSEEAINDSKEASTGITSIQSNPLKRARLTKGHKTSGTKAIEPIKREESNSPKNENAEGWNFSKFQLLTDCVSSLAGEELSSSEGCMPSELHQMIVNGTIPIKNSVSVDTANSGKKHVCVVSSDDYSSNLRAENHSSMLTLSSYSSLGSTTAPMAGMSLQPQPSNSRTLKPVGESVASSSGSGNGLSAISFSNNTGTEDHSNQLQRLDIPEGEMEFVCIIRTNISSFTPVQMPKNNEHYHNFSSDGESNLSSSTSIYTDLLLSTKLSAASIVAHDLKHRPNADGSKSNAINAGRPHHNRDRKLDHDITQNDRNRQGGDGDSEENNSEEMGSNNSSSNGSGNLSAQPNSDSSKQRNSTSSETYSEDNNVESSVSETNSN